MNKKTTLCAALVAVLAHQPATAQSDDDEVIEEIITTGTRIVRSDMYGDAGHVIGIDEIAIDASADLNIADVLRASPLNSHGSFSEQSGWTFQSNAFFDLRGLGAERTLVIVDGMRLPGSPNLQATAVNINMLPMAAVSRVDILADGASAVYGSDAMAGVVNVVLHRNFEGLEVSARHGDRSRDDGGDESLSVMGGISFGRGHLVLAAEYSHRDEIYDRDRFFTAPRYNDDDGDGFVSLGLETVGVSYFGRTWEIFDPTTGYYELRPAADCPTTDGFVGEIEFSWFGLPGMTGCGFAFGNVAANKAELEKLNGYVFGSYDITDAAELYVRGLIASNESFGRFAPPAAPWPNPPADHPHSPFDLQAMQNAGLIGSQPFLTGYYRWTNVGPRDSFVEDNQWDLAVGLKGSFSDRVQYNIYAQNGRYTSDDTGRYFLSFVGLDYVLTNGLDPFSPEGAAAMRAETWQNNYINQQRLYAHLQIDAWDVFGAGPSIALIGAEYQEFDYAQKLDPASEAGLVGGSSGWSNGGNREIATLFMEYLLPVADGTDISIAARYDNYSDFGGTVTPSIGIVSSLTDSLTVRARWGEGFAAPDMDELYGPSLQWRTFVYDPVQGVEWPVEAFSNSNEDLQPEESTSISAGFNWEYLDGHSLDIAYYRIEVEDVITWPGLQSLAWADAEGREWDPDGIRVVRSPSGYITEIHSVATNADLQEASGVDVQLRSSFDTVAGMFDLGLVYSYQLSFKANAYYQGSYQDLRNFLNRPDTRAQASIGWSRGDHSASVVLNYIGEHAVDEDRDFQTGVIVPAEEMYDPWISASLAYRYDAGNLGQIRVGANNVFDEDPALDPRFDVPAAATLYDWTGRVIFVEYRNTFDW